MLYIIVIGVFVLLILLLVFGSITIWLWTDKFGRNLNTAERERLAALEAEVAALREVAGDLAPAEPSADE